MRREWRRWVPVFATAYRWHPAQVYDLTINQLRELGNAIAKGGAKT